MKKIYALEIVFTILFTVGFSVTNASFASYAEKSTEIILAEKLSDFVDGDRVLQKKLVNILSMFAKNENEAARNLANTLVYTMKWDIGDTCADQNIELNLSDEKLEILENLNCQNPFDLVQCSIQQGFQYVEGSLKIDGIRFSYDERSTYNRKLRQDFLVNALVDTDNFETKNYRCSLNSNNMIDCETAVIDKNIDTDWLEADINGIKNIAGYNLSNLENDLRTVMKVDSFCQGGGTFFNLGKAEIIYNLLDEQKTINQKKELFAGLKSEIELMQNSDRDQVAVDKFIITDNSYIWAVETEVYKDGILAVISNGQGTIQDISFNYLTLEEDSVKRYSTNNFMIAGCMEECDGTDNLIQEIKRENSTTYQREFGEKIYTHGDPYEFIKQAYNGEVELDFFQEKLEEFKMEIGNL